MDEKEINLRLQNERRHREVGDLINMGTIGVLWEIFDILPKTIVSKEMHLNYKSMLKKGDNANLFTIQDVINMAELFSVSEERIYKIMRNSILVKNIKKGGN